MKNTVFTGSSVAIVTPMNNDRSINLQAFKDNIEFQISNKTDAIVVCGTTGESSTLSDKEKLLLFDTAVQSSNGRVPIIAGVGSNDTAHAYRLAKETEKCGVDAFLSITPYYNKTSQRGIVEHFKVSTHDLNKPTIIYNVPSRTGMTINPETYLEICTSCNICGIKEASANICEITKIISKCGKYVDVYSGNDDIVLPLLSIGAKGVISVVANIIPNIMHEICQLFFDGKIYESMKLQLDINDLISALFSDVNPIPIKFAMNACGHNAGPTRLPLVEPDQHTISTITNALKKHNII